MLRKQLKDVEVELVAQLATATISLRQILDMKAGDIIPLSIPEQITASVDEIPLMECHYGQQGGRYALKIDRFISLSEEAHLGEQA